MFHVHVGATVIEFVRPDFAPLERRSLLLGRTDEDDIVVHRASGAHRVRDVVLALLLLKADQRNVMLGDERIDSLTELAGHTPKQGRRRHRIAAVLAQE